MKILWAYLKPHRRLIILSLLLAGIAQLLSLIDPIIFGKIIDNYATNPGVKTENELVKGVSFWLGIAVVIALLARLAKSFQEYVMRLVVQKFGMQIFNDGLKQTLRLSFEEFEGQRSGETLSVLQKVRTDTERFINSFINIIFSSVIGLAFLIWYAITKHWLLIPVFVIGILVLGGLTGLLSKKIKTLQRSINRETNQMSGAITESLRNIELVKSLGLTFPEIKRLREHTKKIFDLEMLKVKKVRKLSFLQSSALTLLKQSILFILLWLIFRDVLTTGELISMQFISTTIFGPLQDLGNIILSYREAEASLRNFDKLMKQPVETRPEEPIEIGPLTTLSFNNVVFRHKTASHKAIDDISFTVKNGETIGFYYVVGEKPINFIEILFDYELALKYRIKFIN